MGFSAWQTSPVVLQCFVTGHLAHSWPSVGFCLRTWQQGSACLSIIALHWITVWIRWGLGIPIWTTHNLWTILWMTLLRTERAIEKILDYGQLWKNIGEHIILTHVVVIKDLCQSFQCGHCPLNTSHSFTAPTSQPKHNEGCKEKETKLTIRSESATALNRSGGPRKEDAKRESHPRADLRSSRL